MSRVTSDLTCNETMPTSDEKLDARPGYRPGGYGGPSTSTGQTRFTKTPATRALYPGSLIPSMSGLPQGLSLPGAAATAAAANNSPKIATTNPLFVANAANAAMVAQREAELRREQAKKKEDEEQLKKSYEEALRASSLARTSMGTPGPSTSTAHPGIIRPTPTMPSTFGTSLLHQSIAGASSVPRPVPATSHAGLLAAHDYLGSAPQIREPQVKQIPKGGGLVHAPYNPAMKNRLEHQRDTGTAHTIARPIPRHIEPQTNPAQFALSQAAQAQQEAVQRTKALQEKREAEARLQLQQIERERNLLLERQRQEEERQMRSDMSGVAPIVRPVQRGVASQPILDPSRNNRGLPAPIPQRFPAQNQQISMATAMANAAAAAAAAAHAQKEREDRERFERERDRLERAAAEPMTYPNAPHPSPLHIPSILQGRTNWPKLNQNNSPLRAGYSPLGAMSATGLGTSGAMPTFDQLLGLNSSPYARLHQGLFNPTFGTIGQHHVSPSPSTPQVLATPSPRPSILRRKGNDNSAAKRRLGFDESNPQTVGELASAQLASGVIGLSDAKKIKIDADIKKEPLDVPSTSSNYFSNIPPPITATEIKREPGIISSTSAEPTPQKKRQRKQQFDSNQAPEQISMQITEPPFVPIMGMHSTQFPGEMLYYQLPPEAPKKKRGRPSSLAKEQAMLEAQSTTRSIIVDVDEPKIIMEKKKGGRKKPVGLVQPTVSSKSSSAVKDEPLDITFTPPPRPSSSTRPKSAILQQHHAALQQAMQQQEQRELEQQQQQMRQQQMQQQRQSQTPQTLQSPPAADQSPFTYAGADDFPLDFDSDEELVSAEALAAAREVAEQLGLIGPDGEPKETTPVRLAREEEEAEEEEERHRELMERLNSAGLQSLQTAIRKKEELERQELEDEEREEREEERKEKKALRRVDRRLRFLSHDKSIIRRFFRKVKGLDKGVEISDDSETEERNRAVFGDDDEEEKEEEESSSNEAAGESGDSEEDGSAEDSDESGSSSGESAKKSDEEDSESELVTLTEEELKRMKDQGDEFDLVREVDEEDEDEDNEADDDDDDDEDDEDDDEEENAEARIDRQKNDVERINAEMRLERLLEEQRKKEEKHERDEELETEIQQTLIRIEELNKTEKVAGNADDGDQEGEGVDLAEDTRKPLIPLDALGDRDDFLRPPRKLIIAPSATPRLKTKTDLENFGRKKAVKTAVGYMKLWKRAHTSSENTRGIVVEEPVDIERDLLKARRRDTMIERAFNRLKKKTEHDRLREKMRQEIIERRNSEKKRIENDDKDEDTKTVEKLMDDMEQTLERQENEEKDVEVMDETKEEPKDEEQTKEDDKIIVDGEPKEEGDDETEKLDDSDMLEEGKGEEEVEDEEVAEDDDDDEEEDIDPIERARIQKENEELLKLAIKEVDAKLEKRERKEGVSKCLQSYFAKPSGSSTREHAVLRKITTLQKNNIDEEEIKEELEALLKDLIGTREEKREILYSLADEELDDVEDDEESDDDGREVEVSSEVLKITATKKTRLNAPIEEWHSLASSIHQADVVDLFGVPFAQCEDDDQLIPVVSVEEQEAAKNARFAELGGKTAQKVEKTLTLEERYQDDDALPRAITRFRRNETVDNAMMRDNEKESDEIDQEIVEDQIVGFLTTSISSTKREALLEKQMTDLEKKEEKLARSESPILNYKRKPNRKSIMGNCAIEYNAREKWTTGNEDDPVNQNKSQQKDFVRRQFERLEEERRAKLDSLAERAVTLREDRHQLPSRSQQRQDAAKEMILEKYSKKTRSLMLQAYNQYFDTEGQEMEGASTSGEQQKASGSSARNELTLERIARISKYVDSHELEEDEIATVQPDEDSASLLAKLKEFGVSGGEEKDDEEEESEGESYEEMEVKEEVEKIIEENEKASDDSEDSDIFVYEDEGGRRHRTRIESDETFDLEDIRKICDEEESPGGDEVEGKEEEEVEDEEEEKSDEDADDEEEVEDEEEGDDEEREAVHDSDDNEDIYAVTSNASDISAIDDDETDAAAIEKQREEVEAAEHSNEEDRAALEEKEEHAVESGETSEEAEIKEEEPEEDPTVKYEDHVVTMTRGGKTVTHVVRRPSNATAAMKIPPPKKGSPKKKNSTETRPYTTRINAQGKKVRVFKKAKKQLTEDEQYLEFAKTASTRFVTLSDSDPLIHNEAKIMSDMRTLEHDHEKYGNIERRREMWEVTEEEKAQIADEIEDELDREEFGAASGLKRRVKEEPIEDPVFEAPDFTGQIPDLPITAEERRAMAGEDEEMEEESEEEESNYDDSEEDDLSKFIRTDSSSDEAEDEPEIDISTLKPFKNIKTLDTSEDVKEFPWLEEVRNYDGHPLSKQGKKLSTLRTNLMEQIGKMKENIRPKKFYRFKLPRLERKEKYVSPFHSLYDDELPDALENDLNVLKLIMTTSLNDDTLSSSDLVLLRKKINLSKKGFAEVIKRRTVDPPKAFKDLVRFAIQRGERYEKSAANMNAISKWQHKFESGKVRRAKRKAILKEVKVTRQKFNTRFGWKFHRTDWSLKRELQARWERDHLLPEEKIPPRMGNKQLLQEMRRMKEQSEEHKRCGLRAQIERQMEELKMKREKREKEKEAKRIEKGKTNALYRMSAGLSWDGEEAEEAEIRTKGELRGSIIMFDRRAEEIDYTDDEDSKDGSDCTDPSDVETDSEEERLRRERSWTYETVKNSSDDESFVDYGHTHWIGPQVFLDGRESSPLTSDEAVPHPTPKLVINASSFPEDSVLPDPSAPRSDEDAASTSASTASTTAMKTPPREEQPRPFLTLAQRKAYFTEETEEERKHKEEEEAKKKAEEERLERERKEEEERIERLRKEEEERKAEEKRKEEERIAEEKRIEDEKRAEEERIEKEEEEKNERLFGGLLKQIDEDTWKKQLKMIVDRTMTTFRRTQAVEYLLASAEEMECRRHEVLEEIEEWERVAEKKRISEGSLDYLPLKSLFDADSSNVLRKGVKVQKKKDLLGSLPDAVLIEDLVDSMCTFITAHIDDVTILSELRMGSETEKIKIRTLPPRPVRNELLVKRSIAAVGEEEEEMVKRTLKDTCDNHLSVVGATSSGVILKASKKKNPLLDEIHEELAKKDEVAGDDEVHSIEHTPNAAYVSRSTTPVHQVHDGEWECVREELRTRLGIVADDEVDALEEAVIDDALDRSNSPDLVGLVDYACDEQYEQEAPAPISSKMRKIVVKPEKKGIRPVPGNSTLISNSILREISDQLKAAEDTKMEIKKELVEEGEEVKPDKEMLDMPAIENKKLHDEFLRIRDVINAVRTEMIEKIGEVKDEQKLDQYLREHVWSDGGRSSNVQMMIDDMKKQKERERRKLIDIGDVEARVFDLSAKGQFERWMDDVFYLSPFSQDGKRITSQLSTRRNASLHCQLVLRAEEDDEGDSVQRIHPEMVMKWTEVDEGVDEERSEVVHKFASISAHHWDSIQRLIRRAEDERKEMGVVSDEDDEPRPVLLPIGDDKNIVVLEKEEWAIDHEGIVNNDKFIDLELRHSARLLKHRKIGFSTTRAVNTWRKNFSRAFKSGRVMKHVVDENEPVTEAKTPDIRKSIRYKCLQNSIKQARGVNKERVELLGNGLRERHLKRARKAVRKQRRLIRMHYRKIAFAEMRSYIAAVQRLEDLRRWRKEQRAQRRAEKLKKEFDSKMEVIEVFPLFDNNQGETQVKTEFDDEGNPLPAHVEVPDGKSTLPNIKTEPADETKPNDVANNDSDIKPDVDELQKAMASSQASGSSVPAENSVGEGAAPVEGKAEEKEEPIDYRSERMKVYGIEYTYNEEEAIDVVLESSDYEDDDGVKVEEQEEEIRELTPPPHPLRRHVKTVQELSRPLNEREMKLLVLLKEKRAKGETLLTVDDLRKDLNAIPVHSAPDVELLNDGAEPVVRMLLRKVKREEGQADDQADESYVDVFYNVEDQLKEQEETKKRVETFEMEADSDEEEEEGEVDLECVLFQSYPERVKRMLVKAMEKREERIRVATERYEMYRRQKERSKRRLREERERKRTKRQKEESERRDKEDGMEVDKSDDEENSSDENEDDEREEPIVYKSGMMVDADKIPRGFCPRWTYKTVNGERIAIRTVALRRFAERLKLRNQRVIMGRASRRRKVPLTRLHYLLDGQKSKELIRAEEEAEREKENVNNIVIDVDASHLPITKSVIDHFVECQVKSDDAKLEMKEKLIAEHDKSMKRKGVRFLDDDVEVALKEEAEIEKMINEAKSHENAVETFRETIENMRTDAIEKLAQDPFEQLDLEIDEAVENEKRILQDYLGVLQSMDSKRFAELAKLWTFDIESDDDEETLEEKRWMRVRQFVLQKPAGGPKNWENTTAYVDEWEHKVDIPKKREIVEALGPIGPYFRGIETKKRQGYFINDAGFPVKPKKPKHFKPLVSDPERLENSDLEEYCHSDLNTRHEDNLERRKKLAELCNRDFEIRQEEVSRQGLKRKAELMRKFKKTEKNMPEMGAGLQKVYEQKSVFDALPMTESYWSHQRRTNPKIDAMLKRKLENTREMFASVVQPMYRTILVLRETRRRLEYHNAVKDLDSDDEARRQFEQRSDSESDEDQSESERDEGEERPTYALRKRPRLCRSSVQEEDEAEDGDDEDEESDRASSRSDSEREDSPSEDEEEQESEDNDVIIEEQPKKLKKPTLFNRVIKREEDCEPEFDLTKVKEEEEEVEDPDDPPIVDVTPKKRPTQVRKNRGRPRKSAGSGRSDSESPFYEAPPTSLRRATGKRPLITDRSAVEFYDEDEQIRLAIEESLKDQPSTSTSGN